MMNQFFNQENFEKFLSENKSSLIQIEEESIFEAIDFDKIFTKLKSAITESSFGGMLAMFGGEEALEPLRPHFEVKFKESISEIINDENFIDGLMKGSEGNSSLSDSISEIVDSRLDELTPLMVKGIIQEMIREHLGWLVVWGGVFGGLIGLITTIV